MKINTVYFLVGILTLLLSFVAKAEADDIDDFLILFEGACLRNIHNISLVESFAKFNSWQPAPEEIREGMAPIEGNLKGVWIIKIGEKGAIIATSVSGIEGKDISFCSISSKYETPEKIIARFIGLYHPKLLSDETEGYQRYRIYMIQISGLEMLVTILSGTNPLISDMVNFSVFYPIPFGK